MDKRTLLKISSCFIGSILVVVFLQLAAVGPNKQINHFVRIFPSHFFGAPKMVDLKNHNFYIAGLTEKSIYFGDYGDPVNISRIDWNLSDYIKLNLHFPKGESIRTAELHLSVDSPFFFINNFSTGSILRGLISTPAVTLKQVHSFKISTSIFIPCSSGTFAVRTFDSKVKENVLGKLSLDSSYIRLWPHLLEKPSGGFFTDDGLLRFDSVSGQFVYIYFYRNRFLCLDSNFNLRYIGQTLDTNAHAKIRVIAITSQNVTTIASPGFRVNRAACINQDWIFINSDLKADNEENNIFNSYAVIDLYGLKDGRYHFSFYVPKK
ncbi:MAG TPA: hypothetical protein VGZ71_00035, partial [Puia sp.]|nr:hypothetical protein [Puia sp.]